MLMLCERTDVWQNKMYLYPYGTPACIHRCPIYYSETILEVWLTLNHVVKKNMQNDKIFQGCFLKMAAVTLSNFE